jgi:hypothetical protein
MYTNVQTYTQTPRHAEHADTRNHLERHDANQQGRKRKQRNPKDNQEGTLNATIISVRALLSFLDTLLTSRTSGPLTDKTQPLDYKIQQELDLNQDDAPPRMVSSQAARAAALYSSASKTRRNTVLLETTDQAEKGPEIDLSAADMRTVDHLRNELKQLSARNIETLEIHRASNFLASLQNAINAAKG